MNLSYWEKEYFVGDCDYLIVGMGLTGLQTAINLKKREPLSSVTVVDRHSWSLGASTRNAGFACFANISEILDDLENEAPETVYSLAAKRFLGLSKLRKAFGDKEIGYEEKGSVEIFTKTNKADLEKAIDSIRSINTILEHETGLENIFHYSSKSHLPTMIGGIHNRYEGQINTGKLYQSIYTTAQKAGVNLIGGLELRDWSNGTSVSARFVGELEIECKKLILCTNAFSAQLGIDDVVPARGQVIVSQRLEELPCAGIHNFNKGFYYWRDIDDRLLLGGARNIDLTTEESFDLEPNQKVLDELNRFMCEEIVGSNVEIEHSWSGIMGMGRDKMKSPIIKEQEQNVFVAARFGGMGVALSALVAEEMLELLT